MTSFLTVRAFGSLDLDHAATMASLPASLRVVGAGQADIATTTPDLRSITAALAVSPKGLVVTQPALLDDAAIGVLGEAAVPVFPALALAPRLRLLDTGATLAAAGLVRSRLSWRGTIHEVLLEHLAGLEAVLGPISKVRILASSDNGHIGTAQTQGGIVVNWSGRNDTGQSDYELDIIGLSERLEVSGALDGSARPLLVRHGTAGGLQQPHGIFETGLRCFWRAVVSDLTEGRVAPRWPDLSRLHALARELAALSSVHGEDAA